MILKKHLSGFFYRMYVLSKKIATELYIPQENDIFLVSYPRSGNTWMRALMAEMLYGTSGGSISDLQNYVPNVHETMLNAELVKSEFHVIKSHFPYLYEGDAKNYKRVVYLVRDPRDVVLSYYSFNKRLRGYQNSFDEFLIDFLSGRIWPCSWQDHVNSWAGEWGNNSIQLLVIRYEDLVSDPCAQLRRFADFFGIAVKRESIEHAVQVVTVEEMRQKESRGIPSTEKSEGFQFIGKAKPKQWMDTLTPGHLALMKEYAGIVMERHGYS